MNNQLLTNDDRPLILIVDDDRSMRTILTMAMSEEGYRVAEAKNGEECLAEFSCLQPDAILLDAMMPDMDGFTCCQRLRQLPGGDLVTILTITVLDDQESVEKAFTAGATDYITKPIHWAVLSQRLRRLLEVNRAELTTKAIAEQLYYQQAWENLFRDILRQKSQGTLSSEYLSEILTKIQNILQVSQVALYQYADRSLLESISTNSPSLKEVSTALLNLEAKYIEQYQQGKPIIIDDISRAGLSSSMVTQCKQNNIRSLLIVPAIFKSKLWELLYVYSSDNSRQWHESELDRITDLVQLLAL